MYKIFDNANSIDGWTGDIIRFTGTADQVAGNNTHSLRARFRNADDRVEKTFDPVNVECYDQIVFHIKADRKSREGDFLSIAFNETGTEYFLPTNTVLTDVKFDLTGVETIDRIRITSRTDTDITFFISYFVLSRDELPRDIMQSGVEQIKEYVVNDLGSDRILMGTVNVAKDEEEIIIHGACPYLERFAKVTFNNETHTINNIFKKDSETDQYIVKFSGAFDGLKVKSDYEGEIYLDLFVKAGLSKTQDAVFPSITVWTMQPNEIENWSDLDFNRDSYTESGYIERPVRSAYQNLVQVDITSMHDSLIQILSQSVKRFIGRNVLWVNGLPHYIRFESSTYEEEATQTDVGKISIIFYINYFEDDKKDRIILRNFVDSLTQRDIITV